MVLIALVVIAVLGVGILIFYRMRARGTTP
jgi:hypothetical protein